MNRKTHLFFIAVMLLLAVLFTACAGEGKKVTVTVEGGGDPAVTEEVDQVEPEPMEDDSDNPVETEAVEPQTAQDSSGDTTGSDPYDGRLIECGPGLPALAEEWDDGTRFEIIERGSALEVKTFSGVWQPASEVFFTGIDFQNSNGPQTGPIPDFALGEGTTFGVSTAFQGGEIFDISAVRAGDNGELLPWTTAATVEIGDGFVTIVIRLDEIPGGIDMIRFTLSDGEICELSGIFEIFKGFQPLREVSPEVAVALENNENNIICFPDLCFNLPAGAGWNPTAENTGNVTIGSHDFVLQVYTSSEGASDVVNVFAGSGWTPEESGEYNSYQIFDLLANNAIYGSLSVLDGSSEYPRTAAVAATGQNPLSEADQETLQSFLNQVMDTLRPGL